MLDNTFCVVSFVVLIFMLYGMYGIITKRMYQRRIFLGYKLLRGKKAVVAGIIIILLTTLFYLWFLTSWLNQ